MLFPFSFYIIAMIFSVSLEQLPISFLNEIVEESVNSYIIRSSVQSENDIIQWVREFENSTNTQWNSRSSKADCKRMICQYV